MMTEFSFIYLYPFNKLFIVIDKRHITPRRCTSHPVVFSKMLMLILSYMRK